MTEVYAGCDTYRDSGAVSTAFTGGLAGEHASTLLFSTAFVRPSRLRFEFREGGRQFLAVCDGSRTRTWWDVRPGIEEERSLNCALAGAKGISGGAAYTVPAMLMPDLVRGTRFEQFIEPKRLDDAKLGDIDCYRVEGVTPFARDSERQARVRQEVLRISGRDPGAATYGPTTLWIERATFLLRGIDEGTVHPDHRSQTRTTYEPKVNVAISDGELAFDPPVR